MEDFKWWKDLNLIQWKDLSFTGFKKENILNVFIYHVKFRLVLQFHRCQPAEGELNKLFNYGYEGFSNFFFLSWKVNTCKAEIHLVE